MDHPRILTAGLVLLVGGFALALAAAGTVWLAAVGWGLFGIGGVVLVSLVFLLVGESEDRDRARHPHG